MCASSGRYPWGNKASESFQGGILENQYRLDLLPLDICGEAMGCIYDRDLLSALNSYMEESDHPDRYIRNVLESFAAQNYGGLESAYIAAARHITKRERGLPCRIYINDAVYRYLESNIDSNLRPANNALFVVDLLLCLDSNKRYGWNGKEETK